ncbi:MAG: MATE family efflux transporter, partial [Oscillospiraceae bacterium]|nr:MATE family efflux transporter [Oscillospiraceae bacterium]
IVAFVPSDILGGAMRGAGEATSVMLISALCICVFRILWLTFALQVVYDIRVVFLCYAISWTLSSAVMTVFYLRFSRLRRTVRGG